MNLASTLVAMSGLLLLAGCAGGTMMAPAQPTPASIEATQTQLSTITVDPVTAWMDGDYAVRAACHAYLNSMAQRNASLSLAGTAVGLVGAAGSIANPLAGVGSSLAQGFLTAFQNSGAIPYTPETSTLIESALDAYEAGVAASPPTTVAQAASYSDDLWFQCSPGGYAQLVAKSIATANVTSASAPTAAAFAPRAAGMVIPGRPKVLVNDH